MATRIETCDSNGPGMVVLSNPAICLYVVGIPVSMDVHTEEGIATLYMLKHSDNDQNPTWVLGGDVKPDTRLQVDHKEVVLSHDEESIYLKKEEVESLIASLTELLKEL